MLSLKTTSHLGMDGQEHTIWTMERTVRASKKEDYILGQVMGEDGLETRFGFCKVKTHSYAASISISSNICFICTPIGCLKNTEIQHER
jgi:hypothetical protein